jgi:hypothetical protein
VRASREQTRKAAYAVFPLTYRLFLALLDTFPRSTVKA